MKKRKLVRNTRKWHRYLGLLLGVQFFLWTIGGLYFSWTNIDEIRGDNLKKEKTPITIPKGIIAPYSQLYNHIPNHTPVLDVRLKKVLDTLYYEVTYTQGHQKQYLLFNAITGKKAKKMSENKAALIAKEKLSIASEITNIERITTTNKHHEYRGRPLPAYAIRFDKPANTTIYVSEPRFQVETFRNNQWRIFDFLWMLHTMDYQERNNMNNWVLRIFSIFGLFTIMSGFLLYILTSKTLNKKK
ncbi:PepSY domain-containing protein [Aquimarina hainanensis]|uniref:PepSY domain-containing protein n=1 Tax=Aquimarina hainanensis TaxID=1578017 RepID=A0ABW5N4I7_9FLAO